MRSTPFQGGFFSYARRFIETLPIIEPAPETQAKLTSLVGVILEAKLSDAAADTTALENEIDEIVYETYGVAAEVKQFNI